jgi:SAM-dependent methyltransferase
MTFDVAAASYDRFMGRYSGPLAVAFAAFAGVGDADRVLDVGCGTGVLTAELVRRLGAGRVTAVDPSEPFVAAMRDRFPLVELRRAPAEALPFGVATFDVALAQLVVHFMDDPVAGLREMARVTRPGGRVAACVWDFEDERAPISAFWRAAREVDADAPGETQLPGARRGHLRELFEAAGLRDVEDGLVETRVEHPTFDEWWEPFTLGVGPAGAYASTLDRDRLEAIRARCERELSRGPFEIAAAAWAARGTG